MRRLLLIFIAPLIIFWPSLFAFFTNDDFFFLKISKISSLHEFVNFFNFAEGPDGFGFYRPITTQVFYLLKNPILMHMVVFVVFFVILYLIYRLAIVLFKNERIALISVFLYSVSATHFAHFYYLATFQEFGVTLFALLSVITFTQKKYWISVISFLLALASKETAVVIPFILILTDWFLKLKINRKVYLYYFFLLIAYLYIHIVVYGFASGDTYIWDFSIKRLINTTFWYLLWSFNLPETLVDFIGPGLQINPNLFKYWASTIWPILILFFIQMLFIAMLMVRFVRNVSNKRDSFFAMAWFLITLAPVLFLPQHKFSFYLTLPLIGLVYRVSYLLVINKTNNILLTLFLSIWTALSILTINHSKNTSWITNGQEMSLRVYNYFQDNRFDENEKLSFVDTQDDAGLPWSPTTVVKNALSDKNFFYVYYPNLVDNIRYGGAETPIFSRQFLGY